VAQIVRCIPTNGIIVSDAFGAMPVQK